MRRCINPALTPLAALALAAAGCSRSPVPATSAPTQPPESEPAVVALAGGPPPSGPAPAAPDPAAGAGTEPAAGAATPSSPAGAAGAGEGEPPPAAAPAAAVVGAAPERDPLQGLNRRMFAIDRRLTQVAAAPLHQLDARPRSRPALAGVRNLIANLDEPATAMNHVLQRRPKPAVTAVARFLINSTAGLAGMFDVAGRMGLARDRQDFGRTLGRYGVRSGPFIYLPLVGPTNPRDVIGGMADALVSPARWLGLPLWERHARAVAARQLNRIEAPEAPAEDYVAMRRAAVAERTRQVAQAGGEPAARPGGAAP